MAARCALLILLCASRGVFWVLEQPQNSLLEMHAGFQALFSLLRIYRKRVKMGDYCAATDKPTWLYAGRHGFL